MEIPRITGLNVAIAALLFILSASTIAILHGRGRETAANISLMITSVLFVWMCMETYLTMSEVPDDKDRDRIMREVYPMSVGSCYAYNARGYFIPVGHIDYPDLVVYCSFSREKSRAACEAETARIAPEAWRILALGDSFTEADGVHYEDTWPLRLQEELARTPARRRPPKVVNCGVGGNDIDEIVERYTTRGERHRPQVVIYAYFLNDIHMNQEDQRLLTDALERLDDPLAYMYKRKSGLVRSLIGLAAIFETPYFILESSDYDIYLDILMKRYYAESPTPELICTLDKIAFINRHCAGNGRKFMVVIFPIISHLEDYPFTNVHRLLVSELQGRGVAVLDLLSLYAGWDDDDLVVNEEDAHPNELGHKMAAEAIAEELRRLGWDDAPYVKPKLP